MLRQSLLQEVGQHMLCRLSPGAGRAGVEMRADLPLQVRTQSVLLIIKEMYPHVLALHAAPYLA